MPNIREQSAPQDLGLRPTEAGYDARLQAARRLGAFANQAAEAISDTGRRIGSTITDVGDVVEKFETNREISKGAADGAKFVAQKNDQWNEIAKNADPNDPTIKQKFLDGMEKELEKFRGGFMTERSGQWAERFVDQYRNHMYEKTSADMATLAGIAVQKNARVAVNSLSSAVASDPSSLDFALSAVEHKVGGMADSSPNLSADQSAKVKASMTQEAKETIVKSAISGMIQKNPNIDLDAVQKKYGAYINGAEMKMFQKAAQTQAKVDMLQQKQLETYQRQQNERAAEKSANDNLTKNVTIDPQTGRTTVNPNYFKDALDIARMPDAPVGLARTLIDWGEHQQDRKAQPMTSDPAAASSLDARMFSADNPTSKMDILRAEADRKLTRADAEIRSKIIDQRDKMPSDPMFKIAMDGAKQLIEGRTAGEKSLQSGKYASFMQQFLEDYQRQKAAGTLPPNALSLRDPNSLLSKTMEAYKSPLAAAISSNGGVGAPAPAPRNDAMPAIPAPENRPANSIYETPRGKMKWTGTGWVTP